MTKVSRVFDAVIEKVKDWVRYIIYVFGCAAIMVSLLTIAIEVWLFFNGTPISSMSLDTTTAISYWCAISFSLIVYDYITSTFTK